MKPERKPEPRTLQECLRQSAEAAMSRGDLVTRGDCYMAAQTIDRLELELAEARRHKPAPQCLSNDELKDAIEYSWQTLYKTGTYYSHHAPMLEHYKVLLKEQQRRATLGSVAS